jgi:hypothetical protein
MTTRLLTALAAVAVLVSAVVHLLLWFDGVRDQHVIGPAFLLNAVGGAVIAVLLVVWRGHWIPPFLAAGFGASTLGAFVISATVGLFGVHEQWTGGYVWTAAISEAVALVTGLVLLGLTLPVLTRGSAGKLQHRSPVARPHLH